jgi:hypothetical protein
VSIGKTTINTSTGNSTSYSLEIPIASSENVGLMSNADVNQIQTLTAEVNSLKGIKKNFVVNLDSENPTQGQLWEAFQDVSELEDPTDGVTLWDQIYNKEYIYFESDQLFHDRGDSTIAFATNDSPGVVQGDETSGKVYVENDGTMSLIGYDSIIDTISGLETNKIDVDSIVDNLTSTDTDKPLSANQGKALKGSIDSLLSTVSGKLDIDSIVDDLVSTDADKPLSANKGKVLNDSITAHTSDTDNPHGVTKSQVGLGNVDNTSDDSKPLSEAMATALNNKEPLKYVADSEENAAEYSVSNSGIIVFYPEE